MEHDPSDTSGTDDDLLPSHQHRGTRGGRITGNGRSGGAFAHPRGQIDIETQIHLLEQEAYGAVLRAFKAQADAITWEKEGLITDLRRELRVSDDEHRELLNRVNADDTIQRIREWRQAGGPQSVHDSIPSPTVSGSRKRPKTSELLPSLSFGAPSSVMHTQPVTTPSSSAAIRGVAFGSKGKKPKSGRALPGVSTMRSLQIPSTGPSGMVQIPNRNLAGAAAYNALVGRKVWTRWPEDDNFYEAAITDYDAIKGLHALVYDINSGNETWEWVNLNEISPEDIRWDGEDPGISQRFAQGGPGPRIKKPIGRSAVIPGAGSGRASLRDQSNKDLAPSTNGHGMIRSDEIEIFNTKTLLKEVEQVIASGQPDPLDIEKAKRTLKEHEQSLIEAIARLGEASEGESEDRDSVQDHQQWNQQGANYVEDPMATDGV